MLTRKKQLFVSSYSVNSNATQAAKDAGYSEKTAYSAGQRLLKNVEVNAALEQVFAQRRRANEITAESLLKDCEEIKERCLKKEMVKDHEGNPNGEWKFDSRGALKAIEIQARIQGLFTEKHEVEHSGQVRYGIIRDFEGSGKTILKAEFEKKQG